MIEVGEEIKKDTPVRYAQDLLLEADTQFIENKHTGKYISNLNYMMLV